MATPRARSLERPELPLDAREREAIGGDRLYLLLSLRPPYYYQMRAGTKRYEYRRRFVARPSTCFLYLGTNPRDPLSSTIPARLELGQPIIDHPARIGELAERQKPGASGSILAYMRGLELGYAIPILSLTDIQPIPLDELRRHRPTFMPPQSYLVLNNIPEMLELLLERPAAAIPSRPAAG